MADPNQAVIMSNGQLYTTSGTQALHPPPYNSYLTAGNPPPIKQEYASSPNIEDQNREAQPPTQPSQQQQAQPSQTEGKFSCGHCMVSCLCR